MTRQAAAALRRVASAVAFVAATATVRADAPATAPSPKPTVEALRLERKPTLEDFLGMKPPPDLDGKMAVVRGGFLQRVPVDGMPSSQYTDVYLGYDDAHLYVIFVAFDAEPEGVRANLSRRENLFGDDIVEIQLDTFLDERRSYVFICNPLGVQFDAIWTETDGFDDSFDTVWSSRGRLTDRGYVVWMEIPFKSLRFPRTAEQRWGMILVRDIPRASEETFWPGYSTRIQGRLNQAGILTGLREISPGRNIQFIPYASTRSFRIEEPASSAEPAVEDTETDVGLDTKFVFKDSLVLDLTANPDFSQVESDEPQVTVNQRFEVFFPEKRPFFLENASYFDTPVTLFFTRRIGEPRVGARLTGKAGPYAIGLLAMDDEAPGAVVPVGDPRRGDEAEIRVARVERDIIEQSGVGFLYTERRFGDDSNRVAGIDGRLKWDDHWIAIFQSVGSWTRMQDGTDATGAVHDWSFNRTGRHFNFHGHYIDVDPSFHTDVGFVPRADYRDVHQNVGYTFRPEGPRLLAWTPALFVDRSEDHDGLRLDRRTEASVAFEFRRQTRFEMSRMEGEERLRPADFAGLDAPRDYEVNETEFALESEFSDRVNIDASFVTGRGINFVAPEGEAPESADLWGASVVLTLRPARRVRLDATYLRSQLEEPDDAARIFTDEILRARLDLQIDPRISLRLIARHDDFDVDPERTSLVPSESLNLDFLFTYLANPWTAVYVGYNSNLIDPLADPTDLSGPSPGLHEDARQFFVKLSYLLRP